MPTAEKRITHTAGPWAVHENRESLPGFLIEPGIGKVYGIGGAPLANARLIASAPDLLEALKTTAGNIRSLGPAGALKTAPMEYREWLRVVDEAIAKAEGRA